MGGPRILGGVKWGFTEGDAIVQTGRNRFEKAGIIKMDIPVFISTSSGWTAEALRLFNSYHGTTFNISN